MKCTLNKQEQHCDHSRWHTGPFIFSSVSHFHSHHQRSSPCLWNVLSSNLLKFHAFLLIICISGCFAIMDHRKDPCLNPPMVHYWLVYYHQCILISASIFELLSLLFFFFYNSGVLCVFCLLLKVDLWGSSNQFLSMVLKVKSPPSSRVSQLGKFL